MKKPTVLLISMPVLMGIWAWPTPGTLQPAAFAQTEEAPAPHPGFMAAKGRVSFNRYCASCHGTKGDGTGSVAKFLKVAPSDLRKITQRAGGEFPREKMIAVIDGRDEVRAHGSREMPIWGEVLQSPLSESGAGAAEPGESRASRMISELVYFLETLQEPYEPEVPTAER